jgi:hypothetical protein
MADKLQFGRLVQKYGKAGKTSAEQIQEGTLRVISGAGVLSQSLQKFYYDVENAKTNEVAYSLGQIIVGVEQVANQFNTSVLELLKIELGLMLEQENKEKA